MAGRTQSFYFIEGQFRPRGDHQKIVVQHPAVAQLDLIALGMNPFRAGAVKGDALALQIRRHLEFDGIALAPVDGNPRIGGNEMKCGGIGHHRNAVARTQ